MLNNERNIVKHSKKEEENFLNEIDGKMKVECGCCGHDTTIDVRLSSSYQYISGTCLRCGTRHVGLKRDQLRLEWLNNHRKNEGYKEIDHNYLNNRRNQLVRVMTLQMKRLRQRNNDYKDVWV